MINTEEKTISIFAKRSDKSVLAWTSFIAIAGALFVIFLGGDSIWSMWIPLCFITIPPIHYLSREVIRLRAKLEDLENRLG